MGPISAAVIRAWIDTGHHVAGFWHASPPEAFGRDRHLSWLAPRWSVAAQARRHGFQIRQVRRLATWPEAEKEVRATGTDVLISAYFRYLVPRQILDVFGSRAVNLHPAPLPRYRGPDPILAMVLDRSILTDGAMTLHVLNDGFDEGPIIAREPVALSVDLDIARYQIGLAQAAARLTVGALQSYLAGDLESVPQDASAVTYARLPAGARHLLPTMTADEIRWRCRTLARMRPLRIASAGSSMAVGFRRIIGPATGKPPTIGPLSVAFDAVDARVSVWRKLPGTSRIRRLRRLAELARTAVL